MRGWLAASLMLLVISAYSQDYSLDRKLGAENSRLVEQQIGLYQHDSLQWLVNAVGQKLVGRLKNKPFDFHFFLADSAEPNAFALPGGYIYVTRGILPLIQTEDELAGIIAHEIIHVMQQHSVKQLQKSALTGLLKIPGNLVNALTGTQIGNIINTPIGLATAGYIAKYSRGHETESDKFGIQLAASAGYRTDALADALERLTTSLQLITGEAEKRNYFSDHPYTPSRVTSIRSSAKNFKPVNPSPLLPSQASFIHHFDGLCFGTNPQQGVFADNMFIHPDLRFTLLLPPGWKMQNNPSRVAAMQEKGEGIVALQAAAEGKSPREIGLQVQEQTKKSEGITVLHAGDTILHGITGYILRLKSTSGNETAYLDMLWLNYHNTIYQLAGMATLPFRQAAYASICSFTPASEQALQQVMLYEWQVVKAHAGENLESLSKRTDNRLKTNVLAVFNNYAVGKELPANWPVKIVRVNPYVAR